MSQHNQTEQRKIHNAITEVSKGDCIIMGDFNHGNIKWNKLQNTGVEYQQFLCLIQDNLYVPMKKQGKRPKKKHLSKEAFGNIIYKQDMWRVYKPTGKDKDYEVYMEALNAATNEVRNYKLINFEHKLAQHIKSDGKSFYVYVRSKQNVRDKV